jgi:hypothetical protein
MFDILGTTGVEEKKGTSRRLVEMIQMVCVDGEVCLA